VIVCGSPARAIRWGVILAKVGFKVRTTAELFGRKFVTGWAIMRGEDELNVRGVKLVGLGAMCGAIGVFAIGLAADAPRLVTAREETLCTLGLITCPVAV
jgi:hypothetical protein